MDHTRCLAFSVILNCACCPKKGSSSLITLPRWHNFREGGRLPGMNTVQIPPTPGLLLAYAVGIRILLSRVYSTSLAGISALILYEILPAFPGTGINL